MTPERMKAFLTARPSGANKLVLLHDSGLGATTSIATWPVDDITNEHNPTPPDALAEAVHGAAVECANSLGEVSRFSIQWQAKSGTVLRSAIHKVTPEVEEEAASEKPGMHEPISANRLVSDLLAAHATKDKVMQQGFGIVMIAYEKAMQMQNRVIDQLSTRLAEQPERAIEVRPEDVEVVRLKSEALRKVIDIGPDLASLAITAIAKHFGLTDSSATNGSGGNRDPH